jgi:hypothetical protein
VLLTSFRVQCVEGHSGATEEAAEYFQRGSAHVIAQPAGVLAQWSHRGSFAVATAGTHASVGTVGTDGFGRLPTRPVTSGIRRVSPMIPHSLAAGGGLVMFSIRRPVPSSRVGSFRQAGSVSVEADARAR